MGKINIQTILKEKLYAQGINAVPLYLNLSAWSGMTSIKKLGFTYTAFFFPYQNNYGEMNYILSDFDKFWDKTKKDLNKSSFLPGVKKLYEKRYQPFSELFEKIKTTNLRKLPETKLIELFRMCAQGQVECVGVGHIIEMLGIKLEQELRNTLTKEITEKSKFNHYFSVLTTPSQPSFLKKQDTELLKISKLKGEKQTQAIKKHVQKYYWIQNTYQGPRKLNATFFQKHLEDIKKEHTKPSLSSKKLIKNLRLSKKSQHLIKLIDFSTIWQDERKINILINISYLGKVLEEISKRCGIPTHTLGFLGANEALHLTSLHQLKKLKPQLQSRSKLSLWLMTPQGEIVFTGKRAQKIVAQYNKIHAQAEQVLELHGLTANGGQVIGRAVICNSLASLSKVKTGDVLVASMTRPEYMTALKKAAAIVTDEGGITCHAAIVARELNIPCIIGTKIATKTIKDGNLVEVKANHGVVKIL